MEKQPIIGAVGLGGESVFLPVDHFHAPGETLQAGEIFREPGGKAYNQAVAARRLGAETVFFGAMGQDKGMEFCVDYLKEQGVTPVLEILPQANTAYACILTDKLGENRVTVSRGAAQMLSPEFIRSQEAMIRHCTHMLLGLECPLDTTKAALALCQKHGIYAILNPAPAIPLDIEFLLSFDLITPNQQEAAVLLGLDSQPEPEVLAEYLIKAGFRQAVVTLGSHGSLLLEKGKAFLFPALNVQAVDTTGAGDTFNAALAVALGRGKNLQEAVIYAIHASAYSVSRHHVMDSLPTAGELEPTLQPLKPISL